MKTKQEMLDAIQAAATIVHEAKKESPSTDGFEDAMRHLKEAADTIREIQYVEVPQKPQPITVRAFV